MPARIERVRSVEDPRVADYHDVKDGVLRREAGLFMVEGVLNLETLVVRSPFAPRSVFVTPTVFERHRAMIERLPSETPVYVAPQDVYDGVSGFHVHRGCLAVCERFEPATVAAFCEAAGPRLVVALEGLTNEENVGAVFRNAMAFGASGVLLCPRCADPLYRKAIRVSMGGTLCVPHARAERWPEALGELRAAGHTLIAMDPGPGACDLRELPRPGPARVVVLLGTEGAGIASETLAQADRRVRVEMAEGVDSLNVATAGAIALHHLAPLDGGAD